MKYINTLKLSGLLLYSMFLFHPLISQTCATNGLVITRQGQIDSFQINFGACDKIDGYLMISGGANITSLTGLSQLTSIEGNLIISNNDNLIGLKGLNNLTFVGGSIEIAYNDQLELIEDLGEITSILGDLKIHDNSKLKNLFGFNKLKSIGGVLLIYENPILRDFAKYIVWGIYTKKISAFPKLENALGLLIRNNPSIIEVDGFPFLNSIGIGFDISKNDALEEIKGFGRLQSVGFMRIKEHKLLQGIPGLGRLSKINGNFYLEENQSLTTFSGLANLDTVLRHLSILGNDNLIELDNLSGLKYAGQVSIGLNDKLLNLDGLSNLSEIKGFLWIYYNPELSHIYGLGNLKSINGVLGILQNARITTLNGLEQLDPQSIHGIHVAENRMLEICAISTICSYLQLSSNFDIIRGNAPGCERADILLCNCNLLFDCASHEDNFWTSSFSVNWFESEDSWTRRHFPGPCENVELGNNLGLNLRTGEMGKCHTLEIKVGSQFYVEVGAELDVMVESTGGNKP